ncbi:hypothetical protein ACHAXT_012611 [Thalassiosira profunda]
MSVNTAATDGSRSANSSTHGRGASTNTYPQLSKDATQVIYPWLPHSTALGAASTVAVRVRNASLAGMNLRVGRGNDARAPIADEKKLSEGDLSRSHQLECRVEASVCGHGLPLQAAAVSTRYSSLVPYDNSAMRYSQHPDFACGNEWAAASFDALVSLPVRWRDLTRDACLVLNVFCDGGPDNDGGGFDLSGERIDGTSHISSRVWGTTLPLFDRSGRLRSGLHKLQLHADVVADGGMSYACKIGPEGNELPIETFLEGGATPGIADVKHSLHSHAAWFDGKKLEGEKEDDPKWKASLILHELDRLESSGPLTGAGTPRSSSSIGAGLPQQAQNARSASWLDALTRERCLDILHEQDGDDSYFGDGVTPSIHLQQGTSPPTSSHHTTPYLIIELPTPPIPVLHEEPIYPVETSTHLRGTTGSITANELIKFHSKLRSDEECDRDGLTVPIHPLAVEMSSSDQPQAFLYPLVQVLDHEPPLTDEHENPQDNPAQDKYRILAHDLIRGLVDPGLKPDRVQRGRLERIVGSPSYHLSTEEKDLLWRFRFSLVDNRRALTKFLLAVDWTVESEVVQAAELLEQWRKRSPIEVTDALKLLGRNVAFQTSLVRSYAIDRLSDAPDDELRLYLLQLVQALKYEEDISGGVSGGDAANAFGSKSARRVSSLSMFLIERASRNIELANFLFWYLKVEMHNPIYEARYREVFIAFQEKLSAVRVCSGSIIPPKQKSPPESTMSLWQLLMHQERFISGILGCQQDSLEVRGKKDAKETHLRESLAAGGFQNISHAVPLPSAPHIWVKGVNCGSAKMFKSALYPAVLDFAVDHIQSGDRKAKKSSKAQKNEKKMYKVMIKTGDDLRQDQLVIMMIQLMDRLLKRGTLDLCLRPYSILAMPNNTGLMEFVERSIPVSQILSGHNNSVMEFFQSVAPQEDAKHSVEPEVLQTYIRSCAGYCVLTYLLGVGDRHLDNIMIQPTGHFFHIGKYISVELLH